MIWPTLETSQSQARRFLEALCADKPVSHYLLIWTLPEKESRWFANVEDAVQFAELMLDHDLYVGVGLAGRDYGAKRRCPSHEIAAIFALWVDIDFKAAVHSKAALPPTVAEALEILPEGLPPTFLISSGHGLHGWWGFIRPWSFESGDERRAAEDLIRRWQTLLRSNAAARGWSLDFTHDLARVLRVPGTKNCKDPANPKAVEILSQTDRRYSPSDFEEFLETQGALDADVQERAVRESKVKLTEAPLVIDPSATVPEHLLERYMAEDHVFKRTWLRQREDLKDQSQSGYDLALANFAFRAGLTEQETVNLIIHHRRIRNQHQRTRLDYFQRTIATAFNRSENAAPPRSALVSGQVDGEPPREATPDTATARALLCERISEVIGVRVLNIIKVSGAEPTYRLELETTKIAFDGIDKLVGQHSFRMKIASAVNHLVPRIPAKVWDRVAQMMLNALTIEDGGDDVDLVGAARLRVDAYLVESQFIEPEAEPPYQARYKPAVYEGQVAICSHDLQQHINKAWGENRPIKEVTAMLSALGAVSTRLKRTRLRDQSRWLLPSSEFAPEDYTGTEREVHDGDSRR